MFACVGVRHIDDHGVSEAKEIWGKTKNQRSCRVSSLSKECVCVYPGKKKKSQLQIRLYIATETKKQKPVFLSLGSALVLIGREAIPVGRLPREGHQRWVKGQRQEEVAGRHRGHGKDGHEVGDAPVVGDEWGHGEDDHASDEDESKGHGEFEL